VDGPFVTALAAGLRRFMQFCGATGIDLAALDPSSLRGALLEQIPLP
jgi:hypothetical protein